LSGWGENVNSAEAQKWPMALRFSHRQKRNKCMERRNWYSLICTLGRNPIVADCHGQHTFFFLSSLFGRPVNPAEKSIDINASGAFAGLGILCVSVHTFFLLLLLPARVQPPFSYRNLVPCPSFSLFLQPCSHVIDVIYIQSGEYRAKRAPRSHFLKCFFDEEIVRFALFSLYPPFLQINNNRLDEERARVMVPDSLSLCYFPCCCCCSCCKDV